MNRIPELQAQSEMARPLLYISSRMLKRNVYSVVLFAVIAQISSAQYLNSNTPISFGSSNDCAECAAATQVPYPMPQGQSIQNIVTRLNNGLQTGQTGFINPMYQFGPAQSVGNAGMAGFTPYVMPQVSQQGQIVATPAPIGPRVVAPQNVLAPNRPLAMPPMPSLYQALTGMPVFSGYRFL